MKKISLIVAALAAATVLSFSGCTTGNSDLTIALKPVYIIGGATASDTTGTAMWGTNRVPLSFDTTGVATYEFTYAAVNGTAWGDGTGSTSFKLLLDDAGATAWATSTSSLAADTELVTEVGGPNNIKMTGLATGNTYKITITCSGATVKVSWKQTAAAALADANVTELNSVTAVQTGAYVKIEGASYASLSGMRAYFNGNTTATAIVQITTAETNDWKGSNLGAWFKFYAGDNDTLKAESQQFYSKSTTLGNAVAISATKGTEYDNFVCTDMTGAAGIYKLTIETTTSGATMKLEKLY